MPLSPSQTAVLSRVASQVARSFRRTHPWLEEADLASEAWVAMLEALPSFPGEGELAAYLYRSAVRGVKLLAWRLSVAANVPSRSATSQTVARLRAASIGEEPLAQLAGEAVQADEALDTAQRGAALAQVVAEHLAAGRHGEAVRAVLTGEAKSAEVAEREGVPVAVIYEATKRAKLRIAADPRVKELL